MHLLKLKGSVFFHIFIFFLFSINEFSINEANAYTDANSDLAAGFDISKNLNGFDINFNAKQSFNKNADQEALISLIKRF